MTIDLLTTNANKAAKRHPRNFRQLHRNIEIRQEL
jgi:hypothetical protein